ncbi:MAG: GNAT family N-acetyltransferase [Bacteroidia bacterium]
MNEINIRLEIINQELNFPSAHSRSDSVIKLLEAYREFYPAVGFYPPWVGYFIYIDNEVVGSCGFTGKPENDSVEIAYWTFPEFEGKGIASMACSQLIDIALRHKSDIKILAKTEPTENASTKILKKNGFIFHSISHDDEIGEAWLWFYQRKSYL